MTTAFLKNGKNMEELPILPRFTGP